MSCFLTTRGTVRVGGVGGYPGVRALTPHAMAAALSGFVSEDIWQMGLTLFKMAAKSDVLAAWDQAYKAARKASGGGLSIIKVRARAPGARVAHMSV